MTFDQPVSVGKRERFQVGLISWLAGEALQSFTVEPDESKATVFGSPAEDSSGVIGFFLDGVEKGRCKIHINYETATRSGCTTVTAIVNNC